MTQKAPNLKIVKESSNKDSSKVSALSPREIVSELDRYVIGQHQAKRAVAGMPGDQRPERERRLEVEGRRPHDDAGSGDAAGVARVRRLRVALLLTAAVGCC